MGHCRLFGFSLKGRVVKPLCKGDTVMKKLLVILVLALLALASCGGDTSTPTNLSGRSDLLQTLDGESDSPLPPIEGEKSPASRGGNVLLALIAFAAWLALYKARKAAERTETTIDDKIVGWLRRIVYGGPLLLAAATALLGTLIGVCSETAKGYLPTVFGAWWWWLGVFLWAILSDWWLGKLVLNKGWAVRWLPVLVGWLVLAVLAAT